MQEHDWLLTAFICAFVLSLAGNMVGFCWSVYRELSYRKVSDTLLGIAESAGHTMREIQGGLAGLCHRIEEDRSIRTQAKRELSDDIKRTGEHISSMLNMLASVMKNSVSVTNMNSDGQGQIGENSGGVHKHD